MPFATLHTFSQFFLKKWKEITFSLLWNMVNEIFHLTFLSLILKYDLEAIMEIVDRLMSLIVPFLFYIFFLSFSVPLSFFLRVKN